MKKISFLFVAVALFGIALISCKPAAAPVEEATTEVIEEAAPVVDTAIVVDTTAAVVEE